MSWNIQKPGDFINGPLTVTGPATITGNLTAFGTGGYARFGGTNYMEFNTNVLSSLDNSGAYLRSIVSTASNPTYSWTGDTDTGLFNSVANTIGFSVGGTTAMTLNSTGLGVGVVPSYRLTVQGADNSIIAQLGGTNRQVRLSTSAISAVDNASFNFIHTSGSGRFTFQNNSGTQTMLTIDDNGNNILRMPVTPPTLGVNLEGTFNLTSNTNLRISVRGSDGTTRVANITLA
jgi:hypothetical protein